jgi:hypothetical protein
MISALFAVSNAVFQGKMFFLFGGSGISYNPAMRTSKSIHIINCHAEGEVGDVIVGGMAPPPGNTIWEQSRFIASDQTLRNFVLNEPRGGVFRHVNLLVPPKHPEVQMATRRTCSSRPPRPARAGTARRRRGRRTDRGPARSGAT